MTVGDILMGIVISGTIVLLPLILVGTFLYAIHIISEK